MAYPHTQDGNRLGLAHSGPARGSGGAQGDEGTKMVLHSSPPAESSPGRGKES